MVSNRRFWQGKRVFVTGHTGFKGGWLTLWLQEMGAQVTGYSLPAPTEPSLYAAARVGASLADEVIADIRDRDAMQAALRRARPEIVLHLAAQAVVLHAYNDPVETFSTNVVGTVALLDAMRHVDSVRAAVIVTSDKCYDNREWPWGYREIDAMGGADPYSASKGATELAVAAMRQSYFSSTASDQPRVGVASVRAGNVIGGGDWAAHRLVPDLMRALLAGTTCIIRHPESVRPWQHVMEPLCGYLLLAEALWEDPHRHAGGWNFGPPDTQAAPVGWVADELQRRWGGARTWAQASGRLLHENCLLRLDASKARAALGWAPVFSLSSTLDTIINWYRAYVAGTDMRDVTLRQIARFEDDAARDRAESHQPAARLHQMVGGR